jgi:cytochrome c oxidase subunit IV
MSAELATAESSPTTPPKPAAGQAHDDFAHHVRGYLYIFYALLFGTVITVAASYIPFGNRAMNVGVALVIACCKATLVAGYFMHLISERRLNQIIYGILAFTVFFFIGLMFLTLWALNDFPRHTVTH